MVKIMGTTLTWLPTKPWSLTLVGSSLFQLGSLLASSLPTRFSLKVNSRPPYWLRVCNVAGGLSFPIPLVSFCVSGLFISIKLLASVQPSIYPWKGLIFWLEFADPDTSMLFSLVVEPDTCMECGLFLCLVQMVSLVRRVTAGEKGGLRVRLALGCVSDKNWSTPSRTFITNKAGIFLSIYLMAASISELALKVS